jgi:hypothetical protein
LRNLVLSGRILDDDTELSPVLLALGKNTGLKTLKIDSFGSMNESLCTAMKDGLGMNETLESLELNDCLCDENSALWCRALSFLRTNKALKSLMVTFLPLNLTCLEPDFSPFLLALGNDVGLKALTLGAFGLMDESLSTAMKDGLGLNETLESLKLKERLCDENFSMWCRALSFLRTNKALKSLIITFDGDATKSCFVALCRRIAAMLQENASLESLFIRKHWTSPTKIKAEEFIFLVTALQHNSTLKSLNLKGRGCCTLTDDEDKQMAALLKKNCALESLPGIRNWWSDSRAILRLNVAGRRYLVQDGSSISKGVEVLSRVNDDINCLFLHLSENPRLCDRSAVEEASAGESNGRPTDPTPSTGGGKREQASAHKGKESRMRLA